MNRGRAHLRHADWVRRAVEDTLLAHFSESQPLPEDWWEETADSPEEAKALYEKYLIERRLGRSLG